MYIAHVDIVNQDFGMAIRSTREIELPEEVTNEDEAVKYLTERRYTRFTLYELRTIGTYAPQESPVVRVS